MQPPMLMRCKTPSGFRSKPRKAADADLGHQMSGPLDVVLNGGDGTGLLLECQSKTLGVEAEFSGNFAQGDWLGNPVTT